MKKSTRGGVFSACSRIQRFSSSSRDCNKNRQNSSKLLARELLPKIRYDYLSFLINIRVILQSIELPSRIYDISFLFTRAATVTRRMIFTINDII